MKFEIPKIVKKLMLADYAKEFGDQYLEVWVNPTKELNDLHDQNVTDFFKAVEKDSLLKSKKPKKGKKAVSFDADAEFQKQRQSIQQEIDAVNGRTMQWYASILSQGEKKISADEFKEILAGAHEMDPAFELWLCEKIISMIVDHRNNRKN